MKLAVITPFYNGERYLKEYFERIKRYEKSLPSGSSFVLILVNDSPKVDLDFLCKRFKEGMDLRIITNEKNLGIHASRVIGLKLAKELYVDYLTFLDQDDEITGVLINEKSDIIISNALIETKNDKKLWVRSKYQENLIWDIDTYANIGTQIISPGQCLIKVSSIPKEWSENILKNNGADDVFLWMLMMEAGASYFYTKEAFYVHKYTGENISTDTKVTDKSVLEFISIMKQKGLVKKDITRKMERMIRYKSKFRSCGILGKCLYSLANLNIFIKNINYKIKTGTRLGFGR